MKVELIAGRAFVRDAGKSRPLLETLSDLIDDRETLYDQADAARDASMRARANLTQALIAGDRPDREAVRRADAALDSVRAKQQANAETFEALRTAHASLTAADTAGRIRQMLSDFSKHFDTIIRKISA